MQLVVNIVYALVNAYSFVIFVYVLMSWLPDTDSGVVGQVYRALGMLCDPYLNLFRRLIPPIGGVMDISPIFALLVLQFVPRLLVILINNFVY